MSDSGAAHAPQPDDDHIEYRHNAQNVDLRWQNSDG
jgi:hypothetical protein